MLYFIFLQLQYCNDNRRPVMYELKDGDRTVRIYSNDSVPSVKTR